MRLLYCYILFQNEKGIPTSHCGLDQIELNLSPTKHFSYNSQTNTLQQKSRKAPLPPNFWSNNNHESANHYIYNLNVIAGENGSGKTTTIRCILNLLEFYYTIAKIAMSQAPWVKPHNTTSNRSLLLLEEDSNQYILNYDPHYQTNQLKPDGFNQEFLSILTFHSWEDLIRQLKNNHTLLDMLPIKMKVIHLTNTLNHYDYDRNFDKQNDRLHDYFIYDISLGSIIGSDINRFFPHEVFKQIYYVFNHQQAEKRSNIEEFVVPHSLQLRFNLDLFQDHFSNYVTTAINKKELMDNFQQTPISSKDITFSLSMLCVMAYANSLGNSIISSNLSPQIKELIDLSIINDSSQEKSKQLITELEHLAYVIMDTRSTFSFSSFCTAVCPDNPSIIVSGSSDASLRVWDIETGRFLRTLPGHKRAITCLSFLPDGRIISGSRDDTLRIWDIHTGEYTVLAKHTAEITCVACLSEELVISGSYDMTLRIWNIRTSECLYTLDVHTSSITCMTVLPNGYVVSGSNDGMLCVWAIESGRCLHTLSGDFSGITCIANLSNNRVISGSRNGSIYIWDINDGQCLKTIHEVHSSITCIVMLNNGYIVSGHEDNSLYIWDPETGICIQKLYGHAKPITCAIIIANNQIVSGSMDNTIRIWNTDTGKCIKIITGSFQQTTCLSYIMDNYIISGSANNLLQVWDISSGQCRFVLSKYMNEPINPMSNQTTHLSQTKNHQSLLSPRNAHTYHSLAQACIHFLDFLAQYHDSFFSKYVAIDSNIFILSLDTIKDNFDILSQLLSEYQSICVFNNPIDFNWELSSGEENIMRIFSNLFYVFDQDTIYNSNDDYVIYNNERHSSVKNEKIICNSILLCIDEADLTLHPEWQRCLIKILTTFIPQIYPPSCAKDIQLILTTHSPLILGDIPNENLTYLFSEKTKNKYNILPLPIPGPTFGQNIHTILKDSFFLDKGTAGAFAADKINTAAEQLLKIIKNSQNRKINITLLENELEDIQKIIHLVAPGVLRVKLENLFQQAKGTLNEKKETHHIQANKLLQAIKKLSLDDQRYILETINQETLKND